MMNVFFYLREFPVDSSAPFTGPMKAIDGMACALSSYKDIKVTVLCEGEQNSKSNGATYAVQSFALEHPYLPFYLSQGLRRFITAEAGRESLFILNGNFNPSLYSLGRCLTKADLPYVAASHSAYHPAVFRLNPLKKWSYWYTFERPFLNRSCAIQVLDKRQAGQLTALGVRPPVIEVLNGFCRHEVVDENRLAWNQSADPRIMYFGRLDLYTKGLDLLLEAFGNVQATRRGSLLLKGPDHDANRQVLQDLSTTLGIADHVAFDGPEYQESAPAVMQHSDIVCLPSRYEGFGLTALEAMIAGRVLLVSEHAGIAPHVKASRCGMVVKPEVHSIQKGLETLLHRRADWAEMGLRGRRYAMEHLSWERIAGTAIDYYSAFMSAAGRTSSGMLSPQSQVSEAS